MWFDEVQKSFDSLKEALMSAPVLALPNFDQELIVETDASNSGIGAVLIQSDHPIAFISRMLSVKHQALSVYDKEMFTILFAVKKWHQYLVGRHFKIKTDHQPLKFLLEQKVTTPSQHTWLAKLMAYDYEILYKHGKSNTVAHALSRCSSSELSLLAIHIVSSDLFEKIQAAWNSDQKLKAIIQQLRDGNSIKHYAWSYNQLRRKGKLVIGDNEELK